MKTLKKENWSSSFNLIGAAKINEYTYKIDEKSEGSDWIYNAFNLGVDCGEKHGVVYAEMMGGYSSEKAGVIFAHGKKEDGSDDFDSKIQVDWEDRFDDSILEGIGELCFITVGLEKTNKDKTFYKKFLSSYDAIAYIKSHLEDNMVINVKGNLKYSTYNGKTQVRKNINSIVLSKIDDVSKYAARFTQTVLLAKDSVGDFDKSKGIIPIYAKVLDYVKEINGVEVKGNLPLEKMFEFEISNPDRIKDIKKKVFDVKKNITQITFEGNLIEGGAVITATEDDIPDEIKELIDLGVFSLEEALVKCSENGNREQRMVFTKPLVKMIGEEGKKVPVIVKTENKFTEEEISEIYAAIANEQNDKPDVNDTNDEDTDNAESSDENADSMDWLNNL